ncbi:hypothetical protein Tco_1138762 [Tanacetum coccineum]
MPSHFYKKFRWVTVFAIGRRSFIKPGTGLRMKRTNRRNRVPIGLYPCHIEEKMTIKEVKEELVMKWKTKVKTKEGIVIKFPGKFRGYKLATEEEVEENEGLKEVWEQMEYVISDSNSDLESIAIFYEMDGVIVEIVPYQLQNIIPQIVTQVTTNVNNATGGNGNGGNDGCSYKTFTACNPKEFDEKGGAVALTRWIENMESVFDNSGCTANQRVKYAASCFVNKALTWWNTQVQARGREAAIVPHMVTLESSRIKRYINGLTPQIRGMLRATQPTTIQCAILKAGILTDEAVRCGTLTKGNDNRKEMQKSSKQGSTWKDNKKSKTGLWRQFLPGTTM